MRAAQPVFGVDIGAIRASASCTATPWTPSPKTHHVASTHTKRRADRQAPWTLRIQDPLSRGANDQQYASHTILKVATDQNHLMASYEYSGRRGTSAWMMLM